jgi:hypothetical protein
VEAGYRTATEVVQAAVAAMEAEHWGDVLAMVKPEAVQALRDSRLPSLVELEGRVARTPEQVQSEQPWLPPTVAAFYAEQEHTYATQGLAVTRAEWGVSSLRELEKLSPSEFFIRYLAASSPAAVIRAALANSRKRKDWPSIQEAVELARLRQWVVLGEVTEGTDKAHVVYREFFGVERDADSVGSDVRLTTLDFSDGRWWLRIDHTLLSQHGWGYAWAPDEDQESETADT